jgi:hypothetical protein
LRNISVTLKKKLGGFRLFLLRFFFLSVGAGSVGGLMRESGRKEGSMLGERAFSREGDEGRGVEAGEDERAVRGFDKGMSSVGGGVVVGGEKGDGDDDDSTGAGGDGESRRSEGGDDPAAEARVRRSEEDGIGGSVGRREGTGGDGGGDGEGIGGSIGVDEEVCIDLEGSAFEEEMTLPRSSWPSASGSPSVSSPTVPPFRTLSSSSRSAFSFASFSLISPS